MEKINGNKEGIHGNMRHNIFTTLTRSVAREAPVMSSVFK